MVHRYIEKTLNLRCVQIESQNPARARRLQEDCLLDTTDETLHHCRSVLRVRMESGKSLLTFKGPVQPSNMKLREELETVVGDGPLLLRILEELADGRRYAGNLLAAEHIDRSSSHTEGCHQRDAFIR